jgi:hypothetical protein
MARKPWDHASCAGHIPAREYGTTKRLCYWRPEDEGPTRQLAALCATLAPPSRSEPTGRVPRASETHAVEPCPNGARWSDANPWADATEWAGESIVRPEALASLLAEHRARKGTPVAPVRAPVTRAPRARKEAPTMPESTPAAEPATDPAPATGSVKRPARLTCVCGKSYLSAGDETVGAIYHRTWTAKAGTYGPQLAHFVAALAE